MFLWLGMQMGFDNGCVVITTGRNTPVASMDQSGKIIWASGNEVQTVNIKQAGSAEPVDGERLMLSTKELGTCDNMYIGTLSHNNNGRSGCGQLTHGCSEVDLQVCSCVWRW